jgi:hypothetical protein
VKTRERGRLRADHQVPDRRPGPRGYERLPAMTGPVLVVLFITECLTLLSMGDLLSLHVFLGMLLIGPVSVKIGSTLRRFTWYYTVSAPCVRKGPPDRLQQVLGPFVILTHGGGHRRRRRAGRGGSGKRALGPDPPPVFPGLAGRLHHPPGLVGPEAPRVIWPGVPRQKHHGSFGEGS